MTGVLDIILASGRMGKRFRVLSTDLAWPSGSAPFALGERVRVPSMLENEHSESAFYTIADYHSIRDIAAGPLGVYVLSYYSDTMHVDIIDGNATLLHTFTVGAGNTLAVQSNGDIYQLDAAALRVYNASGSLLRTMALSLGDNNQFSGAHFTLHDVLLACKPGFPWHGSIDINTGACTAFASFAFAYAIDVTSNLAGTHLYWAQGCPNPSSPHDHNVISTDITGAILQPVSIASGTGELTGIARDSLGNLLVTKSSGTEAWYLSESLELIATLVVSNGSYHPCFIDTVGYTNLYGTQLQQHTLVHFPVYDADDFDTAIWTDCTALVTAYRYTQDANLPIDQLSLSVPADWRKTDLARVFRELRVIVLQERFTDGINETDWLNRCWCVSDGYKEQWENGLHSYSVEAKDALKLAHLDLLGSVTGSVVYQADLVQHGALAESGRVSMTDVTPVGSTDAYEFALTITGLDGAAILGNWADAPAPRFWCTNAYDKNQDLWGDPVPLAIGGDAVQAVFGEGVLRISKNWVHSTSDDMNDNTDFSLGLGFVYAHAAEVPEVECYLNRFARPASLDRDGMRLPSDITDNLTIVSSGAGQVVLSDTVAPNGLTLLLQDGTGRRYVTKPGTTLTPTATLDLRNTGVTIAPDTAVVYGDANRVQDVLTRVLLLAGYQQVDPTAPLYLNPIPAPVLPVGLGAGDIILPPVIIHESDELTPLAFCERLRQEGLVPPNYVTRADASGQINVSTVTQKFTGAGIIDLDVLPASPGIAYERTDINIYTRAVVHGIRRQVEEITVGATIAAVAGNDAFNPGLPDIGSIGVPSDLASQDTVALGQAYLSGTHTGYSYTFDLNTLLSRNITGTTDCRKLRPWMHYYITRSLEAVDALVAQWEGAGLCDITFSEETDIDSLELWCHNPWFQKGTVTDNGYPNAIQTISPLSSSHPPGAQPQTLAVYYWDIEQAAWLPLVSSVDCEVAMPSVVKIDRDQFITRQAVRTTAIRLVCLTPCVVQNGSWTVYGTRIPTCNLLIGVWLSQVKAYSSLEQRGVAELGSSDNYKASGETNEEALYDTAPSTYWTDTRNRVRPRTYVVPSEVPWAQDADTANWLAREWLRQQVLDIAPRTLGAVRPDVQVFDTVRFTTPDGVEGTYLVQSTDSGSGDAACQLTVVDERRPYFE